MSDIIRIGIAGYGNLGRGVEAAISQNPDTELVGIFSRRDPASVKPLTGVKVYTIEEAQKLQDQIDVMILCGGSATDLPEQGPQFAKLFNTIDSFDTHAKIPAYFEAVNEAASASKHVSIISVGWDPGLFSLNRLYAESVLPNGKNYTFWGKGLSQGHSDAIRRIDGVEHAVQYTIPIEAAMEKVRSGENPVFTTRQQHLRDCYAVAREGADTARIEAEIVNMPNYFADYDTTVHFISKEEFQKNHTTMAHGGFVLRSGTTGLQNETKQLIEYSLKLDSNPQFTASVLVAYARAAYRLSKEQNYGAKTVFDIAPAYLSPKDGQTLRKEML
ncbi:diaminopimelate dehydrogenase [Candidatus Soleaferrea massiliensis]|uniref:diaminopimelate dehydrogenase n=1 Tax=Candidatus Soleaferrea massiliensis TaxID=1470354 RepID=UPI000590DC39|nr:diaminopimelate dehydrogenase [Candidatus Soleaferrea massiliensis]